jgi:hypothetical protein
MWYAIVFDQVFYFLFFLDLCVECNGRVLDQYDYQIAKTVLSFETPRCLPGRSSLHVTIDNKKTNNQIVIDRKYHQHGILLFSI